MRCKYYFDHAATVSTVYAILLSSISYNCIATWLVKIQIKLASVLTSLVNNI